MKTPSTHIGLLALAGAGACLGVSHVAEKAAILDGAGPAAVAVMRGSVSAALVITGWLVLNRTGRAALPSPGVLPHVALIGILASGVAIWLAILALGDTSATHKGVIQALYPAGTAVFAVLLLGERLSGRAMFALAVVTAGLVILLSRGFQGAPNRGDWLLLITVPVVGFSDTWAKRIIEDISPLTLAAGRQLFGWAFLCAAVLVMSGLGHDMALTLSPWVVTAGLLAGAFVYLFYLGVERTSVTTAATVLAVAPVLTAVLEFLITGQGMGVLQIAGLALILAGIAAIVREDRPARSDA